MALVKRASAMVQERDVFRTEGWFSKVASAQATNNILASIDPDRWLLTHVTIMAGVEVDRHDDSAMGDWLIKPNYAQLVNSNGDAWERQLLTDTYKTFIGANNYCFVAGTRVLMADGTYKAIELVRVGDIVMDRHGKPSKVLNTFVRESNNLVSIKSKSLLSREIVTTGEHPFWTFHARETCPRTGRLNKSPFAKNFHNLPEWVGYSVGVHGDAGEAHVSGMIPGWVEAGKLDPERDLLTKPVSDIVSPSDEINANRATLIGWFLAEGSFMYTNAHHDGESGIQFALCSADEQHVADEIKRLLEVEFGDLFRKGSGVRFVYPESTIQVELSNIKVAEFFKKWCGKWSWAKKMPAEAMLLPKDIQANILMSCMHGDGCGVLASRGYKLGLKSRDLIQQLLFISWRLGLNPTYKEVGVLKRYSDHQLVDGFDVYTDPDTGKRSRPGYLLSYTTEDSVKLELLSGVRESLMSGQSVRKRTIILDDGEGHSYLVGKIKSAELLPGTATVYNFEVEGDNSYIVEGVVVHNCEHIQIPELSKGKVIDAAIRDVAIGLDQNGNEELAPYVDILIATNKEHQEVVRKILSREYNATSMGCNLDFSICTQCGNVAKDETELCHHVKYYKLNHFYDKDMRQRVTAELCGHHTKKNSVSFIDASWVAVPAFKGATLRSVITVPEFNFSGKMADGIGEYLAKATTSKDEHHEPYQDPFYSRAASAKNAAPSDKPADDSLFPESAASEPSRFDADPAADDAKNDAIDELFSDDSGSSQEQKPEDSADNQGDAQPAEDANAGSAEEGAAPSPEAGDGGAAPAEQATPEVSPLDAINTSVSDIKDQLEGTILTQVKQDLMQRTRADSGVGSGTGEDRGTGLAMSDMDANDSLIKWASSPEAIELLRSKYGMDLPKVYGDLGPDVGVRIASTLLAMTHTSSATQLRKFGYSNDEIIGARSVMPDGGISRKEALFLAKQAYPVLSKKAFFREALIAGVDLGGDAPDRLWRVATVLSS